jgi:hypothetical protein
MIRKRRSKSHDHTQLAETKTVSLSQTIRPWFSKKVFLVILLLGFSVCLNRIDTTWGLTGFSTWEPDVIEGDRTVTHMQFLFKTWRHKYPRGQFLVNALFYYHVLKHWEKHPIPVTDASGKKHLSVLNLERLQFLSKIARWITLVMNLGTILAVFLTAWYLSGDYLSAWLAGLTLTISYLFVFYSSIGHVDVPVVFWFSWAAYFTAKAVYEDKWHHYILAGLLAAYAACTKEGYAAYVPGLALVYCILRIVSQYPKTGGLKKAVLSIFTMKSLVAAVLCIALILVMSGFLAGPDEFLARLKIWQSDRHFQVDRPQFGLLVSAARQLYAAIGWPLLLLLLAGIADALLKKKSLVIFALLPLVVFYLLTVVRIRFVADRFMLPAFPGFAILIGFFTADWLRYKKIPAFLRCAGAAVLFGLTTFYCIGLKLDMKHDARVQAEEWFHQNVSKDKTVGTALGGGSALRIGYQGYNQIFVWTSKGIPTSKGLVQFFPDYLVMSKTIIPRECEGDAEFRKKLYAGQTPYKKVASFKSLYYGSSPSLYSIACWPYKPIWLVSIPVDIFEKQ